MKRLVMVVALAALTGCASIEPMPAKPAEITQARVFFSLSDLSYKTINVYEKAIRIETDVTAGTQRFTTDGGQTPVVAWKLPDYGVYRIKFESFVERTNFGNNANVFMSELWLLDKDFNVLTKLSADRLDYEKQSMLSREVIAEEFIIDNRKKSISKPAYIAALTTDKARQRTVMVANFDKEYAKVRARTAPPTPDVYATASDEGVLRLTVSPLVSYAKMNTAPQQAPAPDYVPVVPEVVKPVKVEGIEKKSTALLEKISETLESGDISSAMEARTAVRETHAELQDLFKKNYGRKEINLDTLDISVESESNLQTVDAYFKIALLRELKSGNAQGALAVIDRSESLLWQIDALF